MKGIPDYEAPMRSIPIYDCPRREQDRRTDTGGGVPFVFRMF